MYKEDLKTLVSGILHIEGELSDNASLIDLGLTSLDYIKIVVELENMYSIQFLDSDLIMSNFTTINSIYSTLLKYILEKSCKCIITDCDDTLWAGIAGEGYADSAMLDGDSVAYARALLDLKAKGVLLAICSKNDLANVTKMLALEQCPLQRSDFVIVKTDVDSKAAAVKDILNELGFLEGNVLYIDDSYFELALINASFPQMITVPANKGAHVRLLTHLADRLVPSPGGDRTEEYRIQKERQHLIREIKSPRECNEMLHTQIVCREATEADADRLAELSQRANRFNAAESRFSAEQISGMMADPAYGVFCLEAKDCLGDLGIVSFAIVFEERIIAFVLSCRAFGRDFETELLRYLSERKGNSLIGLYKPTSANKNCEEFYKKNGIEYEVL